MRQSWNHLWRRLRAREVPVAVFDELVASYSAPDRFYHNLSHIEDCLQVFKLAESSSVHPEEVELAIWFHDAIYDTRGGGNERESAAWADSIIRQAGVGEGVAQRVTRLILATCHTAEVADIDEQILVDVDLSILGREEDVFWQYEDNIRRECAWVPERVFKQKRSQILRGFLDREYIYHLGVYRSRFEDLAQENLQKAIAKLGGASGAA